MIDPFISVDASLDAATVYADLGTDPTGIAPHEAFLRGHIPGAVFVDLDQWLAGEPSAARGRHPLPDPETFAAGMRQAGISDGDAVVALDRVGGVFAARLVWMLRTVGVEAAVLDGGLDAWSDRFGVDALETGAVDRQAGTFTARPFPADAVAELDEVIAYADAAVHGASTATVLLDAREAARFDGAPHPLDAAAGHIPGARSLPCRENIDGHGFLLDDDTLRARASAAGLDDDTDVIASCGSGVTACHDLLVLEHLGFRRGRLFPGSWSQWTGLGLPVA